jgi:hypothetical protein
MMRKVLGREVYERLGPQLVTPLDQQRGVRRRRTPRRRINSVKGSLALVSRYLLLRGMTPKLAVHHDVVFFKPVKRASLTLPLTAAPRPMFSSTSIAASDNALVPPMLPPSAIASSEKA